MTQPLKKLSLNIQTFEEIIENNRIYVDKTHHIHNIVTSHKTYFLSRPRRFGKSLLLSTLEAIFKSRKELFEGLAISKTDYAWPIHPVIRLDFGTIPHETADELKFGLCNKMLLIAREHNVVIDQSGSPQTMLESLVVTLSKKNKVAILIDEYDKPILDHIDDIEHARTIQWVLKSFYETIKGLDAHIRFIFLTGITKFTKTAVFSGLNNLNDISEKEISAHLLGYTEAEIKHYFGGYLDRAATHHNITREELLEKIKEWYDGYWFCKGPISDRLYAPLSVMYFLQDKLFENYWFTSGTPSHLVHLIKSKNFDISSIQLLTTKEMSDSAFGQFDLEDITLDALLYQAGYLTIHSYNTDYRVATVMFPNKEVRDSMQSYLLAMTLDIHETTIAPVVKQVTLALKDNDLPRLFAGLQTIIATIPYHLHIKQESYYHTVIQLLFFLIGKRVESEVATSKGRVDLVVETDNRIFIFEFKFDKTTHEALEQIEERCYAEKYQMSGKPMTLVGVNFNYEEKVIQKPGGDFGRAPVIEKPEGRVIVQYEVMPPQERSNNFS